MPIIGSSPFYPSFLALMKIRSRHYSDANSSEIVDGLTVDVPIDPLTEETVYVRLVSIVEKKRCIMIINTNDQKLLLLYFSNPRKSH